MWVGWIGVHFESEKKMQCPPAKLLALGSSGTNFVPQPCPATGPLQPASVHCQHLGSLVAVLQDASGRSGPRSRFVVGSQTAGIRILPEFRKTSVKSGSGR